MGIRKRLIYNTALLTVSSLIMRCIALAFQVWIVGRIGSAGIGLFTLVMSVGFLAATFAVSGIRFASTRLISEELGLGRHGGVSGAVRRCIGYSLFFGIAAMLMLYFVAEPVAFLWIGDARTVLSLKIISFSLPFLSLSSVLAGYFTACGRVYKSAATHMSEQLVRVGLVMLFLSMVPEFDLEKSCAAVVAGGTVAEVFSFLMISILYVFDKKRHNKTGPISGRLTSRMLVVALPLAVSSYARTSLTTLEHLLVPRGLKAAGFSADSALSGYGMIQGMVFPIIAFPSCFLIALAELLVPELTAAQVAGKADYISHLTTSLLRKCMVFAIGAAGLIFAFAESLGIAVYGSAEASVYIRLFAVLAPVMYMDMVIDGCLKGLGQMMHSMAYNIAEAVIGVILVYTLLPKYALAGYIGIIFFTECFNFTLSINRLRRITALRLKPFMAVFPLLAVLGATQSAQLLLVFMNIDASASIPAAVFALLLGCGIYAILMLLISGSNKASGKDAVKT